MTNDVVKLNAIVDEINIKVSEMAELGRDGFKVPFVMTPDELVDMAGIPVAPRHQQSNDLLWFSAIKATICVRELLGQSARIFRQMDDDKSAERIQTIIETIDEQFRPCETAMQIYGRLLRHQVQYETPEND